MWHEARKQERIIRGMIVDYRRRAERRKDFYEKIKAEPTQFLQLHGRPCKIHLDPAVAAAGEGPAIMMPWQGDNGNIIDRFDVRAHLDYITEVNNPDIPISELNQEERQCNYERYRILAQNAFLGISEDKFLQQLAIEEQFGVTIEEKELQKEKLNEKKGTGAAIGYNYNDPGAQPSCSNGPDVKNTESKDSDEDSDLEIIDVDLSIDVNKMAAQQAHELNAVGPQFGMDGCDLFSFLTGDADDAEYQKQLLREEKEKAMFSGRKSRRERRAHRDKKLAARTMSPPSYAEPRARASRSPSRSASRSVSPAPDTIQFITSFGPDEEKPPAPQKPLYADKLKQNLKTKASYSEAVRKPKTRSGSEERPISQIEQGEPNSRSRSRSRSKSKPRSHPRDRSRSRSRSWKSRSRSRSYSRSRSVSSRSRSRSYSPYRRSRSRSRPRYYNRRSRSPSNIASGFANMSRSMSYESFKGVAGGTHRIHEASNLALKSSNALVTDFNHINSNDRSSHPSKPTVPRYYGRRKEDKSSSELSMISESEDSGDENNISAVGKSNTDQNQLRLSGSSSKGLSRETLTLKEKLKRKMQAQLSRQLRADKRAEAERLARESRRQARRDQEMRELAIKLRRKQREMRHQQNKLSSDDDCDRSRSDSSSRHSPTMEKKRQSPVREKRREIRSKTKSPSPARSCPVWETNREPFPHPHRSKPSEEPRRKYEDNAPYRMEGRYTDDRPQNYVRYDRYPNRYESNDYGQRGYDNQNRYEQPRETRWDQDNRNYYGPGRRRPYGGYRGGGGFRGQYRPGYGQAYGQGDGPSHWQNNTFSQDDGRPSGSQAKGKVKLVDY